MAETAQRVYDPGHRGSYLVVQANGGSVTIEVQLDESNWITADTISEDFAGVLNGIGQAPMRLTPAGGAVFQVW